MRLWNPRPKSHSLNVPACWAIWFVIDFPGEFTVSILDSMLDDDMLSPGSSNLLETMRL
jgi:hypothetical protein